MSVTVGLGGASGDASVAIRDGDRIVGVCAQERVTRVRGAAFNRTGLPDESIDLILARAGLTRDEIDAFVVAEPVAARRERTRYLDHHYAHACAAFLPAPFESATIVVCDDEEPYVSVWEGRGSAIVSQTAYSWTGIGFSRLYQQCAEALGFAGLGGEQRMEALARLDPSFMADWTESLFMLEDDHLRFAADWQAKIHTRIVDRPPDQRGSVAAAIQSRITQLVLEFLRAIKRDHADRHICLGGSLFRNSSINTRIKMSGLFDDVFVPIDPGNAGLAIGAALDLTARSRSSLTPFLGPSYTCEEIKATLDNCKLTYQWLDESDLLEATVDALHRGQLVGWFDGAMEWGARSLGARSILASPFSPYVLENLNQFLKQREAWRGYALSAPETTMPDLFDGPRTSFFMECDYAPRDRATFRHVLPKPDANLRVQTVGTTVPPRFQRLFGAFAERSGLPVLVNTSFNGFREPIVCSPRDAVRVFFGTGLDVLVLGSFLVRK